MSWIFTLRHQKPYHATETTTGGQAVSPTPVVLQRAPRPCTKSMASIDQSVPMGKTAVAPAMLPNMATSRCTVSQTQPAIADQQGPVGIQRCIGTAAHISSPSHSIHRESIRTQNQAKDSPRTQGRNDMPARNAETRSKPLGDVRSNLQKVIKKTPHGFKHTARGLWYLCEGCQKDQSDSCPSTSQNCKFYIGWCDEMFCRYILCSNNLLCLD